MEFKGAMGGLYRVTEWISRIAGSNILWALCSAPFLFFGVLKMIMLGTGAGGANEQITLNWAMGDFSALYGVSSFSRFIYRSA